MTGLFQRSAVLSALMMVAAVLTLSPAPAPALVGADNPAAYSACVGPATASAGLVDTVGHFAEEAIDCLVYYGISSGTSPVHFSPDVPITRAQMAVFLARAAIPAGIDLPAATDQGFRDLDLAPAVQDAVNQIAALGISRGTSPTTFHPQVPMDRRQMVLFLYRFLLLSPTGPGGYDASLVTPDHRVFRDLDQESANVVTAIHVMYEMGVTAGRTASTFAPDALVTRGQMALFMTKALSHTNARPTGVSIQSTTGVISAGDTLELHISARNNQFEPITNSIVDVFSISADRPKPHFGPDGACLEWVEVVVSRLVCQIDRTDERLDDMGNLSVVIEPTDDMSVWAWRGSLGQHFRIDQTVAGSIDIKVVKPATAVRVRDGMKHTARFLRLGDAVEVSMQLIDDGGTPVAEPGVRIFVTTTYHTNGVSEQTTLRTYRTDAAGQVVVPFVAADPRRTSPDDSVALDLDVRAGRLEILDRTTLRVVADDPYENLDPMIMWSEREPEPQTLLLRQSSVYNEVARSAPSPVNVLRATLTDQYGDPVANTTIDFFSNQPSGLGASGRSLVTDRSGRVSVRYLWDSYEGASEYVSAETMDGSVSASDLHHYWAVPRDEGATALGVAILHSDIYRNAIIHNATAPLLLRYDSNDRFSIEHQEVSMEAFERALTSGDYERFTYIAYSTDPAEVVSFDLTNTRFASL